MKRVATAGLLLLALLPARGLDLGLMALAWALRGPAGPSPRITLLVAERLSAEDERRVLDAGARACAPGREELPERGWFEGAVHRRMPRRLAAGKMGVRYIDWRGTIDSGAFLAYDVEELRAGRVPREALAGRAVLHGPRGTGMSELVQTPAGPMSALEYAANAQDSAMRGDYGAAPWWLQALALLLPLVPAGPRPAWLAVAGGLVALGALWFHVLAGLFAFSAGWLAAWKLGGRTREEALQELLEGGRADRVLELAQPGEEYFEALALVASGKPSDVEALLDRADLRRFPAAGAAKLSRALEEAGHDAPALVLLEWAIAAGGHSPELSARAVELRARQAGLRGLLGLEGIQRLISGRYGDLAFLGQGGMGIVLKGRDTYLDRPVAIKVLQPSLLGDPGSRARFRREVETMMKLDHPNIIEIHAVHSEDLVYFSMELLEGRSVREALREDPASVDREGVLRTVADAMAYCHEKGILHRDLKSDNVFLTAGGRVKLIDFGVARAMGGTDLTVAGEMVGTLCYLAPELFRGGVPGPRTDVFSFGVMAYEMYAGKIPFAHPLAMGAIIPPPGMPQELCSVMLGCLAKDPAERLSDFRQVVARLE